MRQAFFAVLIVAFWGSTAHANPRNGNVVHGDVTIEQFGNTLQILQDSDRGIIEWDDFSIGLNEVTKFVQPDSQSATLNRVLGSSASSLEGLLQANGRILLINPNGVLIGPNGRIDTAGFLASTLDLSDGDFLGGGDLFFSGSSNAAVVNLGSISASDGDVILIANQVSNDGTLSAPNGMVGLGAGTEVLLAESGNERMLVRGGNGSGGVDNAGLIEAQVAEMKAGGSIFSTAIRNSGRVRATGVQMQGGRILLRAGGGTIVNSGPLEASRGDGLSNIQITTETASSITNEPGAVIAANQVQIQTPGGEISQQGSVIARSEVGQIGRVEFDAGLNGSVKAGIGSSTAGERMVISAPGGKVELAETSLLSANQLTMSVGSGKIVSSGQIMGTGDAVRPSEVSMDANGGRIEITATGLIQSDQTSITADSGNIQLSGQVIAQNGGRAVLRADQGEIAILPTGRIEGGAVDVRAVGGIIRHQGVIEAVDREGGGGTVTLNTGSGGKTEVFGVINAKGGVGNGGSITVTGEEVAIRAGAVLNASGADGGGSIQVGGSFQGRDSEVFNSRETIVEAGSVLKADALDSGAGGSVIVWSDGDTNFQGEISARGAGSGRGGFAEVSGKELLTFQGIVDLGAEAGASAGTLLLDPTNFSIESGGAVNTADPTAIVSSLTAGTNVMILTDALGSDAGDVWVKEALIVNAPGSAGVFTILAHRDINVEESIQIGGSGGAVNLVAGWDGVTGFGAGLIPGPGSVNGAVALADMNAIVSNRAFGEGGGSVKISDLDGILVGSQNGPTTVVGFDVQIGSGNGIGYSAGASPANGSIAVLARNDIAIVDDGSSSFATGIGHRSTGTTTALNGEIYLNAMGGDIELTESGGSEVFVGHQGLAAASGNIILDAMSGQIAAKSGAGVASIGHQSFGVGSGDISLEGNKIRLESTGGNVGVGHQHLSGTQSGAIFMKAPGGIKLLDDPAGGEIGGYWQIGHEYGLTGGSPVAIFGDESITAANQVSRIVQANLYGGDVTIGSFGDLTLLGGLDYAGDHALNFVSVGDLLLNSSISNSQSGRISLMAGWNGDLDSIHLGTTATSSFLQGDLLSFGDGAGVRITDSISADSGSVEIFGQTIKVAGPISAFGESSIELQLSDHSRLVDGAATGGLVEIQTIGSGEILVFGGTLNDLLQGPNENFQWTIDSVNSGVGSASGVDGLRFYDIENLLGGTGDDVVTFVNQATLDGVVDGGGGSNFLSIDDSSLVRSGSGVTYTITDGLISRNPHYTFRGVDGIEIVTGAEASSFGTRFFDFSQNFVGGSGENALNVTLSSGQTVPSPATSPLLVSGSGPISFSNIGAVAFGQDNTSGGGEAPSVITPQNDKGDGVVPPPAGGNNAPTGPGGNQGSNNGGGEGLNVGSETSDTDGQIGSQLQNQTENQLQGDSNGNPPGQEGDGTMQRANGEGEEGDGNGQGANQPANQNPAPGNSANTPSGEERPVTSESGVQETTPSGTITTDPPAPVQNLFEDQLGQQGQNDFGSTGLTIN